MSLMLTDGDFSSRVSGRHDGNVLRGVLRCKMSEGFMSLMLIGVLYQ